MAAGGSRVTSPAHGASVNDDWSALAGGDDWSALADYWRWFAQESLTGYEPIYDRIVRGVADDQELLALVGAHEREAQQPNVLLATVHWLVLEHIDRGADGAPTDPEWIGSDLARIYQGDSKADPFDAFRAFVLDNRAVIDATMAVRRTQTNEVGRSAVLMPVLERVHRKTGEPLAWIDLGASAGLNLLLDRYRCEYTPAVESHADASVTVLPTVANEDDASVVARSELLSSTPVLGPTAPPIAWRCGLDRAPIDVTDPPEARWLRACVWPSHADRGRRLTAAIDVARTDPPRLVEADAGTGLGPLLAEAPGDTALCVTTTWAYYYLPPETRAQVRTALETAGRPVHWISLEGPGVVEDIDVPTPAARADGSVIGHHVIDGTTVEIESLGWCHPHGTWIDWRAEAQE